MTQLHAFRTWYSPERQGFMTLDDDVLGIVSQVRQLSDGKITVELDDHNGKFHFVEHCEDGTDRLVFTVEELDQRALDRLMRADSSNRHYQDPYDEQERAQDALDRAKEDAQRERVNMIGEEVIFGLQKDGMAPFLSKSIYIPRSLDA